MSTNTPGLPGYEPINFNSGSNIPGGSGYVSPNLVQPITASDISSFNPPAISIDPITGVDTSGINIGGRDTLGLGGDTQPGTTQPTEPGAVNWATGLNAISGIGQLGLGINQFKLGEDQYQSSLAQYNRNVESQANLVNRQLQNDYRNTLINTGRAPMINGEVDYNALDQITQTYVEEHGVSGAPIN